MRDPFEKKAFFLAKEKHDEETFHHVTRVAGAVEPGLERTIALLHDIIEDTDVTYLDIHEAFDHEIAGLVLLITRMKTETYAEYIDVLADGPEIIKKIKRADLRDHLFDAPTPCPESLVKRYEKALEVLR